MTKFYPGKILSGYSLLFSCINRIPNHQNGIGYQCVGAGSLSW